TFTLNGQRKTFYFRPTSGLGSFGVVYTPAYTPEPGFFGSLKAVNSNCQLPDGSPYLVVKTGSIYLCLADYSTYMPTTLVYTDPYGRVYTIDGFGNLKSVKDLAGNTLTVTPAGITSSNGLSVPFVRDLLGRITQIT